MKHHSPSRKRRAAWFLIGTMLAQLFAPYQAFALTGGPSQPEVQSFEPIGTSEMVDVSSGSFNYNIPLMEVGGYPINLAYHSGVGMDDEASCMGGLGWNINVGVVNRNMRGLPDDFDGDLVDKQFNMKDNITWGGKLGIGFELFGTKPADKFKGGLQATMGGFYNNYKGVGLEFGIAPSFSASFKGFPGMSLGLGLTANSSSGVSFSPQFGLNFSRQTQSASKTDLGYLTGGVSVAGSVNSRQGLQALSLGVSMGIKASEGTVNSQGVLVPKKDGKDGSRSLYGGSATFDFAAPTYSPGGQFSFLNQSLSMAFTIGGELWGNHPSLTTTGYYSKQSLMTRALKSPAYGFLYAHNGQGRYGAVHDFNREKDMPFSEHTPNLPLPVYTNDVYSAVGQGIAGSYQLKRSDVGVLYDPGTQTFGEGVDLSGELGLGNTAHGGADIAANFSNSISKAWTDKNDAFSPLSFQSPQVNTDFEPAYFKIAGEKAAESDPGFIQTLGGTQPVRVALDGGAKSQKNVTANNYWDGHSGAPFPSEVKRSKREKRNQPVSYLNAREASRFGLEQDIVSYKPNQYGQYLKPTPDKVIPRTDATTRQAHHISEVTTLRQDGLRYIYGIPAYNTIQEETGFSIAPQAGDCISGLASYVPGSDNTKENGNGRDNYFNQTTLPAYAHSWLLTAVLSPDYVDVTLDGPTPDDLGTYTRFRYTRIQEKYCWRVPYPTGPNNPVQANYNEGFKSQDDDDKANYVYGEKEYWVLHSVESKTQLAEFYYSNRDDGLGVNDRNGGKNTGKPLQKLDNIVLFSLPDREKNQANAEPIKTVHFTYDYSLQPKVPNNLNTGTNSETLTNSGKLTLLEVAFTFGKSGKGKLSPYRFFYNKGTPGDPRFAYNIKSYNRWGSFQPNRATSCDPADVQKAPSTSDFPYIPQNNRLDQNMYAAWLNLEKIILPSGGVINIQYEANDYAYVQQHRAMEMVEIARFSSQKTFLSTDPKNELYAGVSSPNNYVFFNLPTNRHIGGTKSSDDAKAEIRRRYLHDPNGGRDITAGGYLYFKCLINLDEPGKGKYEYVPGYVKIEDFGAVKSPAGNGNYDMGYVKLETACSKDKGKRNLNAAGKCGNDVNPIAKTAWQFARLNLPRIAYGEPDPAGKSGRQMAEALGSLVLQYAQFFDGFNDQMLKKGFAKEAVIGRSWVRLYSPAKMKIGGGTRVKQITISDSWDQMAGTPHDPAKYGQVYDYTTEEQGETISSGVAAYEPLVGGDENPFRQPIFYDDVMLFAPDNNHYQEAPYGESFFPAPQIVYSRVTVHNLPQTNVTRHASGYAVHEYFTARDFPTKVSDTGVKAVPKRTNPIFRLLKIKHKDYMTAAQGFVVELNDMHGKPKKQQVFDESGTLISGVEYRYRTDAQGLNNEVQVLMPDGKLSRQTIGLECSLVADSRENTNSVQCPGLQLNFDGFLTGVFPTLAVIPIPSWQSEETRFRSMVTTKVVHRYGLLQSTIAYDLGSSVSTENLAWDSETGEVVATKTYNEHDDPVYNVNFPAHWAYRGMQAACKNLGVTFNGVVNNGKYAQSGVTTYFTTGDEVAITNGNYHKKGWVKDVGVSPNAIYIVDKDGQPVHTGTTACDITVIRSGFRNQQLSSVGSVTCLQLPFDATGKLDFQNKQVLQASAVEFDERWQTWCGTKQLISSCDCAPNLVSTDILALLRSQVVNQRFTLKPKNAPANISNLALPALKPLIDTKCGAVYPGTTNYQFYSEMVGNDLVCYFGKAVNETPPCWFPCLTIPNFAQVVAPGIFVLNVVAIKPNKTTCNGTDFCIQIVLSTDTRSTQTVDLCGSSCFNLFTCYTNQQTARCGWQAPGDVVNPYRLNLLGNYRPKRSWSYLTDRVPQPAIGSLAQTNTRTDGYFEQFSTFWEPAPVVWRSKTAGWTWAKEVTRFNPVGNEVENRDVLGRYSAELTGYANSQVTAAANNARYRQIAFEGFEDYNFSTYACSRHFEFPLVPGNLTSTTSHTGKYSVEVQPTLPISAKYPIVLPICPPPGWTTMREPEPYKLHICDCLGKFSPDPGKYVFSAWVKEDQAPGTLAYTKANVEIKAGATSLGKLTPAGQIIEGWQRIFGEVTIPAGATDIQIILAGNGVKAWFDDLRFWPFDAGMKSYVYDERTLRFTYELDENNFFTKYEYDQQGMLERIKKETERGVMTIQESRFGQKKQ